MVVWNPTTLNHSRPTIRVKNILLILGAIVVIGGSIVISNHNKKNPLDNGLTYQVPIVATTSLISVSGGANKDWEKELIATHTYDPKNPTVDLKTEANAKDKPLTSTETIARTLFAKYMSLNQLGLGGDKESQEESVNQVLAASLKDFAPPTYTETQIKVIADAGAEGIRNYTNAVGATFLNNLIQSRHELVIVKEAVEYNDPKVLAELDPIIESYKKALKGLLLIPVPQSLRRTHLEMINNVSAIIYMDQNFKQMFIDPVLSLQAIGYYQNIGDGLNNNFFAIRNAIQSANIKFSVNEGGTFFTGQ